MKSEIIQIEKFFAMKNPNVVTEDKGILTFNTGIYGSSTDNAMPQFCADLLNFSSTHSNMIGLKQSLITGENIKLEESDVQNTAELEAFIAKRNKAGDNLKSIWTKAAVDMSVFEAACLQVIYDKNGDIAEVYHVPTEDVRMATPNQYGQIEYFYVSKRWADISNKRYKKATTKNSAVQVAAFNPNSWKDDGGVQMMYLKKYTPAAYYAIPKYLSATVWILLDNAIGNYELNQARNGYFQNFMLTQQGSPTDKEMKEFISKFQELNMGTGIPNASIQTALFAWVNDITTEKASFDTIPVGNTERFDKKVEKASLKIIEGHNGYSGLIMDSKGADLGGDANKLYTQIATFMQYVTEPMKEILLGGFDRILQVNKLPALACVTMPPKITQPQAELQDLTQNERRDIVYGLPPIESNDTKIDSIPTE